MTIDAYALFDVSKEPVVVRVPALSEPRWYLVQMGDSFDEIFQNIGGITAKTSKEYYFYLASTPMHSYMKYLYKYPQSAYANQDLIKTNGQRSRNQLEAAVS